MVAGIEPPVSLTLSLPTASAAPAAVVSVPPHVLVTVVSNKVILPGAPAAAVGKISLKLTPVITVAVGLVNVIVSVETALGATVLGTKDLLIDGAGVTVSDWLPAVFNPALLLDTAPAGIVLV